MRENCTIETQLKIGAWGRTRTGTCFTTVDFESTASTNFATQALRCAEDEANYTEALVFIKQTRQNLSSFFAK